MIAAPSSYHAAWRRVRPTYRTLIERALIRRVLPALLPPTRLDPAPGAEFTEGPFYENRASRRARGERGHRHGLGALAIPRGRA